MNDLISRSALLEELSSLTMTITGLRAGKGVLRECLIEYRKTILRIVDEASTIEAEPVRHGRWVKRPNTKGQVYCSECGTLEEITDNNFKSKRCPNCGAKMQGGSDE